MGKMRKASPGGQECRAASGLSGCATLSMLVSSPAWKPLEPGGSGFFFYGISLSWGG